MIDPSTLLRAMAVGGWLIGASAVARAEGLSSTVVDEPMPRGMIKETPEGLEFHDDTGRIVAHVAANPQTAVIGRWSSGGRKYVRVRQTLVAQNFREPNRTPMPWAMVEEWTEVTDERGNPHHGEGDRITIYDAHGRIIFSREATEWRSQQHVKVSRDGRFIAVCETLRYHEGGGESPYPEVEPPPGMARDSRAYVFDRHGRTLVEVRGFEYGAGLGFSPGGTYVAIGASFLQVYELPSGRLMMDVHGQEIKRYLGMHLCDDGTLHGRSRRRKDEWTGKAYSFLRHEWFPETKTWDCADLK